jgi:PhnB protein
MQVEPYLDFNGRAEEAVEFYKRALNAEVEMLMRFKDAPPNACGPGGIAPGTESKVMHATLRIGQSKVMLSDGRMQGPTKFGGISLSLAVQNDDQAKKAFTALSEGGQVCVPLNKTFFASSFGIVTDKFGVTWMVIHEAKK